MKLKSQIMDAQAMKRALMRISHEIAEKNRGVENVRLAGILRRGDPIAKMIQSNIQLIEDAVVPCGSIDIGFYRDDLTSLSENPLVRSAQLPFDVNDKDIVLVDDVIFTGRTARAAIEAVVRCGRPRTIQLAVLIDRGHRELPIRPDYVGKNIPTSLSEHIDVEVKEVDGQDRVLLLKEAN